MKNTRIKTRFILLLMVGVFNLSGCMPTPMSLEQNSPIISLNKGAVYSENSKDNLSVGHLLNVAEGESK